jgi:hypothetical protein
MIETKSTGKGRQPSGEKETQETAVEEALVQQSYIVNPSTKAKEVGIARTFETKHPQDSEWSVKRRASPDCPGQLEMFQTMRG